MFIIVVFIYLEVCADCCSAPALKSQTMYLLLDVRSIAVRYFVSLLAPARLPCLL
jgi:hypothetical protein